MQNRSYWQQAGYCRELNWPDFFKCKAIRRADSKRDL